MEPQPTTMPPHYYPHQSSHPPHKIPYKVHTNTLLLQFDLLPSVSTQSLQYGRNQTLHSASSQRTESTAVRWNRSTLTSAHTVADSTVSVSSGRLPSRSAAPLSYRMRQRHWRTSRPQTGGPFLSMQPVTSQEVGRYYTNPSYFLDLQPTAQLTARDPPKLPVTAADRHPEFTSRELVSVGRSSSHVVPWDAEVATVGPPAPHPPHLLHQRTSSSNKAAWMSSDFNTTLSPGDNEVGDNDGSSLVVVEELVSHLTSGESMGVLSVSVNKRFIEPSLPPTSSFCMSVRSPVHSATSPRVAARNSSSRTTEETPSLLGVAGAGVKLSDRHISTILEQETKAKTAVPTPAFTQSVDAKSLYDAFWGPSENQAVQESQDSSRSGMPLLHWYVEQRDKILPTCSLDRGTRFQHQHHVGSATSHRTSSGAQRTAPQHWEWVDKAISIKPVMLHPKSAPSSVITQRMENLNKYSYHLFHNTKKRNKKLPGEAHSDHSQHE